MKFRNTRTDAIFTSENDTDQKLLAELEASITTDVILSSVGSATEERLHTLMFDLAEIDDDQDIQT